MNVKYIVCDYPKDECFLTLNETDKVLWNLMFMPSHVNLLT